MMPVISSAQRVISADQVYVSAKIRIAGQDITVVSTDPDFASATDNELATRLAIRDFLTANTSTVYVIPSLADTSTIVSPRVADIAYINEGELAIRGSGPDKWLIFQGGSSVPNRTRTFNIVGFGNSMVGGIEGGAGIPKDTLVNLLAFNNEGSDWKFETAYPSTTLNPGAYTNIPRRRWGDLATISGNQYIPANDHGGPTYYFASDWARSHPSDTVRMAIMLKGGTESDLFVISPLIDTLSLYVDSLQANGMETANVFVWATGPGEQNDDWYTNTLFIYNYLKDTKGFINDNTTFVITGSVANRDINGMMAGIAQEQPNWVYIYGMDVLPTGDGIHFTAQANRDAGSKLYQTYFGSLTPPTRDQFDNVLNGNIGITGPESESNWITVPDAPGTALDSADFNMIYSNIGLTFSGYVRNNIIFNVNGLTTANLADAQGLTIIGHRNFVGVTTIRDNTKVFGDDNYSSKFTYIFGSRDSVTHNNVYIFGNDRTSSGHNQFMLGEIGTTSFLFGDDEFDFSVSPTASNDGWGFFWNDALGKYTFSAPPGLGGGSTITIGGDIGTPFTVADGQTTTFVGENGIQTEAGTATRQSTIRLLPTAVTPGIYGSSTQVAAYTVDQQGRLTATSEITINHDGLNNFVANEHIDHTSVSISAGLGLTGGGTIAATRTLAFSPTGLAPATLTSGDLLIFIDTSNANGPRKTVIGNIGTGLFNNDGTYATASHTHTESDISDLNHNDVNAIHDNVAGEISAVTLKVTPVSADIILIEDSEDTNNKKRVTVGSLGIGGGGDDLGDGIMDANLQTNGFWISGDGGNEGLFVDASGNVGIGTDAPSEMLHLSDSGARTTAVIETASNTNSHTPSLTFKRSRGTVAVPLAVQSGDWLGQFLLNSHNGTAYEGDRRIFQVTASETWTVANGGFGYSFFTRPNGSVGAPTERMALKENGQMQLNAYTGGTFDGSFSKVVGIDASGNLITSNTSLLLDNLGNGNATTILNMNGFAIQDPSFILFDDGNSDANDWSVEEDATSGEFELELDFVPVLKVSEDGQLHLLDYPGTITGTAVNGLGITSGGAVVPTTLGGGASLTVEAVDGTPSITDVTTIEVEELSGLSVTDQGSGVVRIEMGEVFYIEEFKTVVVPDSILEVDAAGYVTLFSAAIPAGTFTSNEEETWKAVIFTHHENATATDYFDVRLRINDGTGLVTVAESLNRIRPSGGDSYVSKTEIELLGFPDGGNTSIIGSYDMVYNSQIASRSAKVAVDDKTDLIEVFFQIKFDTQNAGDYVDVENYYIVNGKKRN